MKKLWRVLTVALLAVTMIGCGTVETGNVGVRKNWNGKINLEELGPGFYTAMLSSVDEFSGKEIAIEMKDMKPQAGDNLNLRDLDVEVYYVAAQDRIADLNVKYANRNAYDRAPDVWYPAYDLVKSISRNAVYKVISENDSLVVNSRREQLAAEIQNMTQAKLDEDDAGVFEITKVVIRNVQVDPSIQDAIKINVAKDKELEAAQKQEAIAQAQARANKALTASLTPAILRARELDVQELAIKEGKAVTVVMGAQPTFFKDLGK